MQSVILKSVLKETSVCSDSSSQMLRIDLLLSFAVLPLKVAGFFCYLNLRFLHFLFLNLSMFISVHSTEEKV